MNDLENILALTGTPIRNTGYDITAPSINLHIASNLEQIVKR
jgi:hypothetical protein